MVGSRLRLVSRMGSCCEPPVQLLAPWGRLDWGDDLPRPSALVLDNKIQAPGVQGPHLFTAVSSCSALGK